MNIREITNNLFFITVDLLLFKTTLNIDISSEYSTSPSSIQIKENVSKVLFNRKVRKVVAEYAK